MTCSPSRWNLAFAQAGDEMLQSPPLSYATGESENTAMRLLQAQKNMNRRKGIEVVKST
jgi:hypothetical protein